MFVSIGVHSWLLSPFPLFRAIGVFRGQRTISVGEHRLAVKIIKCAAKKSDLPIFVDASFETSCDALLISFFDACRKAARLSGAVSERPNQQDRGRYSRPATCATDNLPPTNIDLPQNSPSPSVRPVPETVQHPMHYFSEASKMLTTSVRRW